MRPGHCDHQSRWIAAIVRSFNDVIFLHNPPWVAIEKGGRFRIGMPYPPTDVESINHCYHNGVNAMSLAYITVISVDSNTILKFRGKIAITIKRFFDLTVDKQHCFTSRVRSIGPEPAQMIHWCLGNLMESHAPRLMDCIVIFRWSQTL